MLFNDRGEVTEFTRGNMALNLGGIWLTPWAIGLLASTCLAELLVSAKITPAMLVLAVLQRDEAVAFFNRVRG